MRLEGKVVESAWEGVTDLHLGECKEYSHYKSAECNTSNLLRINTDRGVMLHDYNFNSTAKPFSILLGLLLSASTRLFVSDVLQISTLLPLLIKYVSSAIRGISTACGAFGKGRLPFTSSTIDFAYTTLGNIILLVMDVAHKLLVSTVSVRGNWILTQVVTNYVIFSYISSYNQKSSNTYVKQPSVELKEW
ncbi:putative alcohol dehydrogenase [Helianthus annuus]|nr:putative alcohol dehydrogenase [Helianthus annuus]